MLGCLRSVLSLIFFASVIAASSVAFRFNLFVTLASAAAELLMVAMKEVIFTYWRRQL